jgi:hypothetical protein
VSDEIRDSRDLFGLVGGATKVLADIIRRTDRDIRASWHVETESPPIVQLTLTDADTEAEVYEWFLQDELRDHSLVSRRMDQAWDDFLRAWNYRLVQKIKAGAGES